MPNNSDNTFSDLIGQIFEASISNDNAGWRSVFDQISQTVSADGGTLNYFHKKQNVFDTIANTNDPQLLTDFNSYYFDKLPYLEDLRRLSSGDVFVRRQALTDDEFEETEIYQDLFRRHGIYHVLHYCLAEDKGIAAGLTFTRNRRRKDFTANERDAIAFLLPYLSKAMQLHLNKLSNDSERSVLNEAWDHLEQGILVVTRSGKVVFKNGSADKIISGDNGVSIGREGKLVGSTTGVTNELRAVIFSVFENLNAANSIYHGGAMLLQRPGGAKPLSISVTPFAYSSRYLGDSKNFALVQITDPDQNLSFIGADLRSIYSLTNAEAQLARLLAEGLSLTQASEKLGVTRNTTRTHLKRIFSKTETNRQSTLVKLILTGPRTRVPNQS